MNLRRDWKTSKRKFEKILPDFGIGLVMYKQEGDALGRASDTARVGQCAARVGQCAARVGQKGPQGQKVG